MNRSGLLLIVAAAQMFVALSCSADSINLYEGGASFISVQTYATGTNLRRIVAITFTVNNLNNDKNRGDNSDFIDKSLVSAGGFAPP